MRATKQLGDTMFQGFDAKRATDQRFIPSSPMSLLRVY
jgi:hypothetical protein